MKKIWTMALVICLLFGVACAEEADDIKPLIVIASQLNGRSAPRKSGFVEALFDHGDKLIPTGRWSMNRKWVEVYGGENGTVWCMAEYLSERLDTFFVFSLNDKAIRIRKNPGGGKASGTVKKNKRIEITQVVMGYGRCSKGWVDLSYFLEDVGYGEQ